MGIYFYKLFDLLNRKGIKKGELMEMANISAPTMAKLAKNQTVQTDIIDRICEALHCQPSDIMEHIFSEQSDKQEQKPLPTKPVTEIETESDNPPEDNLPVPESLKLTKQMTTNDIWETDAKPKSPSDLDILIRYLGDYAYLYQTSLQQIREGKTNIVNFLNMVCNHGSLSGFNDFKNKIVNKEQ
jgi:putative transcriptional regulator